jgi:hypothetical protein
VILIGEAVTFPFATVASAAWLLINSRMADFACAMTLE